MSINNISRAATPETNTASSENELTDAELTQYRSVLDALRFPSEAKDQLAERLSKAATSAPHAAQSHPSRRPARMLRFRRWAVPLPLAAAVVVLAIVLTAGGVAYATGGYLSVGQFVSHLFGADEAEVEVVEHIGRPVGVSATSNGVTVTADAIIGDATNVAVVFSISRDDGERFDLEPLENGLLPASFAEDIQVDLPLLTGWGATGESYLYDADPTDDAIQLVEIRSYEGDGASDISLIGRTMTVHLSDLTRFDENFGEVIAEGDWRLEFPLTYEDATRTLPTGQQMQVNGAAAVIDKLSISPIAVHVTYTAQASSSFTAEGARGTAEGSTMADTLLGLTGTLNLKDGTQIAIDARGGGRMSDHGDTTECETNILFDRIVSLNDVASLTLGGTTIEL